jgi:outer membrane immunogenic protein
MKTFRTIAIALTTAASVAAAAPALAATDGPFTGGYVAAVGGWDRMQADHANRNGFAYGAQAGYDLAAGNVRFGPEVEVTGSTQKGCDHNGNASYCADAGRDFFVGGRVGYVATPKTLVYLTGGYTNARYTGAISDGVTMVSNDEDHSGARIGAGVEYAVTPTLFVKTEYRYSNYSDSIARNQILGGIGVRF